MPTKLPTSQPSEVPTGLPTSIPTSLPTFAPTPLPSPQPTELWVGLVVKASTSITLGGYASASEFDNVQESIFCEALAASTDMIEDASQVNVTGVTATTSRRLAPSSQTHPGGGRGGGGGRGLSAVSLEVAYTLTLSVEDATDSAAVASALYAQLMAAFNATTANGTTAFAASLAAAAAALNTTAVATVDVALSLANLETLTVTVVLVSTPHPSPHPTREAVDDSEDSEDDELRSIVGILLGVIAGLLLIGMVGFSILAPVRLKGREDRFDGKSAPYSSADTAGADLRGAGVRRSLIDTDALPPPPQRRNGELRARMHGHRTEPEMVTLDVSEFSPGREPGVLGGLDNNHRVPLPPPRTRRPEPRRDFMELKPPPISPSGQTPTGIPF